MFSQPAVRGVVAVFEHACTRLLAADNDEIQVVSQPQQYVDTPFTRYNQLV